MTAPLTVVIPTMNGEACLPQVLDALLEGVWDGLVRHLVFADGGSSDHTQDIAQAAGADWVAGDLGAALAQVRTDWVLVTHQRGLLQPGWTEAVRAGLAAPEALHHFRAGPLANAALRLLARPAPLQGCLGRTALVQAGGRARHRLMAARVTRL